MYDIYLTGDSFQHKEDIKKLKPKNPKFSRYWRWSKTLKCWELTKVANTYMTKEFQDSLLLFSKETDLTLEILEEIKTKVKSINVYETEEEYWEDFHKRNGRRYS